MADPHGEEAPTGPRKARPDDRLRAVSNHEATISPAAILRDAASRLLRMRALGVATSSLREAIATKQSIAP